jgi:cytochrome c oxidase assembly protein subunit 15
MLIILVATVLAWRASHEPSALERDGGLGVARVAGPVASAAHAGRAADRVVIVAVRALATLGALTIFAGTAATAAGPHAGGSPGQRINRLSFDGRATMDFVIHRHAEIALAFSLAAVVVWWLARRRGADPRVRRSLTILCLLLALQGAVGLDQYENHLPTGLVWVHVGLACGAWLAALWAACAAGRLVPRRAPAVSEVAIGGPLRGQKVPVGGP